MNPSELLSKTVNRAEFVYDQAAKLYVEAHSDLARLTALSLMLKANRELYDLGVVPDLVSRARELQDLGKKQDGRCRY